ncbi:MIP18 family protein FAM96A, partial [Ophiophagus hannah]
MQMRFLAQGSEGHAIAMEQEQKQATEDYKQCCQWWQRAMCLSLPCTELICMVQNPKKLNTLEELEVVSKSYGAEIGSGECLITIQFMTTMPHCSMGYTHQSGFENETSERFTFQAHAGNLHIRGGTSY